MKADGLEFSRPLAVDRVPAGGSAEAFEADKNECAALAKRLGIIAIHHLAANLRASPWRGGLKVEGNLRADIERRSVISLAPFRQTVEFEVLRYFLPSNAQGTDEDADVDPIVDGEVDLGDVVSETLALELDPYPRAPGESFESAGDSTKDVSQSPFAALAKLSRK